MYRIANFTESTGYRICCRLLSSQIEKEADVSVHNIVTSFFCSDTVECILLQLYRAYAATYSCCQRAQSEVWAMGSGGYWIYRRTAPSLGWWFPLKQNMGSQVALTRHARLTLSDWIRLQYWLGTGTVHSLLLLQLHYVNL